MGNIARVVRIAVLAAQQINAVTEIAIGLKARINHKKQTATDQQHHQRRTPHKVSPGIKESFDLL